MQLKYERPKIDKEVSKNMAINAEEVKKFAKAHGADLVGIGSMDRFEGAPKQMDPRYIFPEAKVIIGLAFRIPSLSFRFSIHNSI